MSLKYPKVYGYRLVEQIGGGGFSMVFRAVNVQNYRIAACKVVFLKPETTKLERKALNKEIQVHHSLKHPNVLDFVGAVIVEPDQDLKYIPGVYMLLELAAGGDLFDKIAPDIGIEEDLTHHYFTQLIDGMTYIHEQGVCHRDLKPENLLLDAAGTLKICDFGLCAVYKLKSTGKTRMLSDNCGSLPYVAPEVTMGEPFAAEPPDIWGCGVILFAMLSGNTPWDEPSLRSYEYTRYVSGKCFDDDPWSRFSEDVLSLLTGMLALEPSERMTLSDVSQHPWVNRRSQIARDPVALAERLTQSLRISGDLAIATQVPMDVDSDANENSDVDADGDQIMRSPKHTATQFTQSLLLFSQTQSGRRYTPHLTRFYTSLGPGILMPLIQEALSSQGTKWKSAEHDKPGSFRLRIGGFDRRKLLYKGWVDLEPFNYGGFSGTFCLMRRDQGNPISWRQLWKAIIMYQAVEPHVFKKR